MKAVLLLAHGTPDSLEDMPEYLRRVRGGRPPSEELIEEMRGNYAAIGGRSPLTDITMAQARALVPALGGMPVYVGMRNWSPYIADVLAEAAAAGVRELVAVPMAPQYSTLSVAKYNDAVTAACPREIQVRFVRSWHDDFGLLEAFAEKVRASLRAGPWDRVLFTAHSLPMRVVEKGDPYPEEVAATARGVARLAEVTDVHRAYQSAGRTPEPWLGPSVEDALKAAAEAGARRVLIAPIGFVCDHTEILYDIDVQAQAAARKLGIEIARTESLNTSPTFIRALADLVLRAS
jgi:protoporphyrin/coproporphyrin ferrochelatase